MDSIVHFKRWMAMGLLIYDRELGLKLDTEVN